MKRRLEGSVLVFSLALLPVFFGFRPVHAQTPGDIQHAVTKLCAVMSGNEKADPQFLQLYTMMEGDMADANPIEIGIQRGVLSQCPKSYLAFQSRARATNPFAAHPLYNSGVQLTGPSTSLVGTPAPQDYPFYCRGGSAVASRNGSKLILTFNDPGHPAQDGLTPGECSWWTRTLRPGEPRVIVARLASATIASHGMKQIDAGGTWTFWVYNVDHRYFYTTAIAKGFQTTKP